MDFCESKYCSEGQQTQDGKEMKDASGEYEDVPDRVTVFDPFIKKEVRAGGVADAADKKENESLGRRVKIQRLDGK